MYRLFLPILTEDRAGPLAEVAGGAKNCSWEGRYRMKCYNHETKS